MIFKFSYTERLMFLIVNDLNIQNKTVIMCCDFAKHNLKFSVSKCWVKKTKKKNKSPASSSTWFLIHIRSSLTDTVTSSRDGGKCTTVSTSSLRIRDNTEAGEQTKESTEDISLYLQTSNRCYRELVRGSKTESERQTVNTLVLLK